MQADAEELGEMSLPYHDTSTGKRMKPLILSVMGFTSLFLVRLNILNCFPEHPLQEIVFSSFSWALHLTGMVRSLVKAHVSVC